MFRRVQNLICYFPVVFFIITICACEKAETVSFQEKEAPKVAITAPKGDSIKIVIGAMITPSTGYAYYRQLLDYISGKIGTPVELIAQDNYQDVVELLKSNKVNAAFICGKPYVDGHDEYGLEILVAPQVNGKTTYHSYFIVHNDSSIIDFEGLRGKAFAFADPESNSGKLVPTYVLAKMGETPKSYFRKFIYTYGHDKSIKAVAQNIIDGAAVDSLIYDNMKETKSKYANATKIIFRSEPYGIPPVVVPKELNTSLKEQLKNIFLEIHNEPEGEKILKGMAIERFVEIDDRAYDGIRKMKEFLR